jgi:two-component system OmpR family response regulator
VCINDEPILAPSRLADGLTEQARPHSMRVLVIEDDAEVARYLTKGLAEAGFVADHAATGTDGLVMAMGEKYDILIVDRMLPGLDGLVLIETLRKSGNHTPVLILSALGDVDQRIRGLRAGGDDYLAKPFSFAELLARIDALLRRGAPSGRETVLRAGDLEMDLLAHSVQRSGRGIDLQPREFRLLEFLMRHAGQVVTRTMLLEGVWDYHFDPQTNVIDVHISRLRQKIDKGFDKPLIHTVRGAGYTLRPAGGETRAEHRA